MSESTITVSQPKIVNLCSRLAKAQKCSATELKGHATALESLAKEFSIQYSLAVEARDEESIKVLQGQVSKDRGEIYETYYKLFKEAVGLGKPMPEPAAPNPLAHSEKSVLQDQLWELQEKVAKLEARIQFVLENFSMKRGSKEKIIPI